jgi:hypothetical protein
MEHYKQGCSCRSCCKCKHSGNVYYYNVSDAAGNAAKQVTRSVTVAVDSVRPIITNRNSTFNVTLGGTFTDPSYRCADNVDGDIVVVL